MIILIAEDLATSRRVLRAQLEAQRHVVIEANDGVEAMAALESRPVDAVISDVLMPGMDGFELCRRIRAHPRLHALPFLVYTSAYDSPGDEAMARVVGADGYLLKPAPLAELFAALQRAVERSPAETPQPADLPSELSVTRQYNAALVRKLEEKNAELAVKVAEQERAERELDRERRLLRKLIDQIPDPIYVKDVESRFLLANNALAQLIGAASPAELLGRTDAHFFPAPQAAKFRADELAVLQGEAIFNQEEVVPADEGGQRVLLTTKLPLRDSKGNITRLVGIGRDITVRKQAIEALRLSEERLQTVIENLSEGLVMSQLDGELIHWNRAALDMHGFATLAEAKRKLPEFVQIFELATLDGRVLPLEEWPLSRLFRERRLHDYELRLRRIGTDWERINSYGGAVVRDSSGQELAFVTITDITERKRAERRILDQARRLDLASDSISERDLADRFIYWNQGSERLYGWREEEILGRSVHETLQPDPADFARARDEVLRTGGWTGELKHAHKDGRFVIVSSRWTLLRDHRGEPRSILTINTDITEKKTLEAQFLRAQRLEALGTLASGVAHDLNNILAPILMSAPILRWNLAPKESEKILATIETSAQRGADLVRQLLTFGRGIEGQRGVMKVDSLIREMARIAQQTFPKSINTIFEIPRDLWLVRADPTQLHQVLLNLTVNARDAMPNGGTLTLSAENAVIDESFAGMMPAAKVGRYLVISVADTGTGIPPKIVDKIFDPFFTTKESGKGTGLGLATVMGIVKSHEGFINLRTEVGQGTTFLIYLPAMTPDGPAAADVVAVQAPRGAGELLLVVDDEESIRSVVSEALSRNGYEVVTAVDGADAVAVYAKFGEKIRAVITDLDMPVMDGVAMIKVLKKLNPNLRILVSSGLASSARNEERRQRLVPLGVKEFVVKPYTTERILAAVHAVLTA